jgi:adenylate cyclase
VASTLVGHLEDFGRRRAARKQPESLEVYECLLLGDWHLRQGTKEDVLRARRMYERAIDMEPANARAHAELAFSYLHEFWSEWTTAPSTAADTAFALASKAVALDDLDSRAHLYLAVAYHYAKSDFDAAAREYERADRLNPNDYDVYCLKSWLLALAGEADEGWSCAERAIRMSPLTTEDCRAAQCFAAYGAKRYDDALTSLRAIPGPTNEVNAFLAMCCAQLGRDTEAKTAMARFLTAAERDNGDFPGTDGGRWREYWQVRYPFKHAEDFEHVMQGLRKAGLP